ncbi:MAG TPA: helix-turn-helix transcriptional regulator [Dehalococcoidales bacterium]
MPTLRDLRKRSYLTQEALARKAGMARETLSRYESGHRKPSERNIQILTKLAEVLHVKLENISFPEKPKIPQSPSGAYVPISPKERLELFVFTLDNAIRDVLQDVPERKIRELFGNTQIMEYILKVRSENRSSRRKKLSHR